MPVVTCLNKTAILALAKTFPPQSKLYKDARNFHVPGTYEVDQTVHIKGTMTVGHDTSYTPTTGISLVGAMALAAKRMGFQRDQFMKVMSEICNEAIANNTDTCEALKKEAKQYEDMFKEEVTDKLPKKSRKGIVKVDVEIF